MNLIERIRRFVMTNPADVTSPEEKRRIEAQQREVRAVLRMLKVEAEVMTERRVQELKRESS